MLSPDLKIIAMIPARLGSQRLKQKNLRELNGVPLITRAIRKCKQSESFHEIWVNSESDLIGDIAMHEGVHFHKRPHDLANNTATSEDFVNEFLSAHKCDYLIQVHSIAPLLTVQEIREFTQAFITSGCDVFLSVVHEQIECACNGIPVNFSFDRKTNSQELHPVQCITWSITGWRAKTFLEGRSKGVCATYYGNKSFFEVNRMSGHVIKTEEDLRLAEAMLSCVKGDV